MPYASTCKKPYYYYYYYYYCYYITTTPLPLPLQQLPRMGGGGGQTIGDPGEGGQAVPWTVTAWVP